MHAQRGFSLLETMIAGVVASLGLSGVAALLIAAVAGTAGSAHRDRALELAVQMAEFMRLSPGQDAVFLTPPPVTAPTCGRADACNATQFAAANLSEWSPRVGLALPDGAGAICRDAEPEDGQAGAPACDGAGGRVVKVFWLEPEGAQRLILELDE